EAQQAELLALVDNMTSQQMRLILRDRDFQGLEAAWRALFFLLRRLETDNGVQLHLLDLTKTELAIDLGATDELTETGLYRLLVEQTVGTQGGQLWAVLTGLYTFDQSLADVEVLGRVAKVAEQAGAPFLSAAAGSALGR